MPNGVYLILKSVNSNPEDEEYLILTTPSNVQSFLDLNDVGITEYFPNSYILTNSSGTQLIQAPVQQIINRPFLFTEAGVIHKGYTIVDDVVVPNLEPYSVEIGDIVQTWVYDTDNERWLFLPFAKYIGGGMDEITSYIWNEGQYYIE